MALAIAISHCPSGKLCWFLCGRDKVACSIIIWGIAKWKNIQHLYRHVIQNNFKSLKLEKNPARCFDVQYHNIALPSNIMVFVANLRSTRAQILCNILCYFSCYYLVHSSLLKNKKDPYTLSECHHASWPCFFTSVALKANKVSLYAQEGYRRESCPLMQHTLTELGVWDYSDLVLDWLVLLCILLSVP